MNGMKDGVYTASARGFMGDVSVEVRIEGGSIANISILDSKETYQFSFYPFEHIPKVILEYQTLGVDVVSGATYASRAVIEAVTDCVRQAGGDVEAMKKIPGPQRNSTEVEELTCDVCVLGTGGSGSSAAASAAEAGLKVIVLEKAGYNGGITSASNCMLAVGSSVQLAAGVDEPMDKIFEHMMQWSHYYGDGRLISKYLHKTASTVDWLRDKGIEIFYRGREQFTDPFECPVHFPHFANIDERRKQLAIVLDTIKEHDGQVFYSTRAQSLIKDHGTIVGVNATREDGSTLIVHANAVVVATGCYDGNKELADKYFRNPARFCMPAYLAEGDGLLMCMDAGADTAGLGARVVHCTFPDHCLMARGGEEKCVTVRQMASFPAAVFVNYRGHRYFNEWLAHNSLAIANGGIAQGDSGDFLVLFDHSMVETLMREGSHALGVDVVPGGGAADYLHPGFFDRMEEELVEAERIGMVVSGATVGEAGEKLGIDPKVITFELDRYNAYCHAGKDEDYFKDPLLLHAMEKGPYYLLRCSSDGMGSIGGIKIDDNMRVIDRDYKVIPGLYAAGACAGGIWGNDSYGILEGSTCSWSWNSGRMAGESAADYVKGIERL